MLSWLSRYLRGTSLPIVLAMLGLMAVSLTAIGVAERADPEELQGFTARQGLWVAVALAGFVAATIVPAHWFGRWSYVLFAATLAFLVAVLLLPETRGSRRWIDLKVLKLQPSELAKLTYILALAWYLHHGKNYRHLWGLVPPFVLTVVPAVLILKEPDLGTTLLLFPVLFFMLFMAGAKLKHLLTIVAVAVAVIVLPVPRSAPEVAEGERVPLAYWQGRVAGRPIAVKALPLWVMRPHQYQRIVGWLGQGDPEVAINEGFQLQQSMLTLGAGGATGRTASDSMAIHYRRLPDDHTDFIYAVIGGRWGFVGCAGVLAIYVVIFICGAEIAAVTHDPFGRLLAAGVLALLFAQIVINVGMTVGLMPITGMTLPLVSYGGSSMLVNGLALGMLVNVGRHRPYLLGREPFSPGARAPEDQAAYRRPVDPMNVGPR